VTSATVRKHGSGRPIVCEREPEIVDLAKLASDHPSVYYYFDLRRGSALMAGLLTGDTSVSAASQRTRQETEDEYMFVRIDTDVDRARPWQFDPRRCHGWSTERSCLEALPGALRARHAASPGAFAALCSTARSA
jgi:hypothetical protein